MLDDFEELEALISTGLEKVEEEKRLKALKKRHFGTNSTQTDREAHAAEVAALELKIIWKPVAQVAVFNRTTCKHCGAVDRIFEARMVELMHCSQPLSRRWATMPAAGLDLPKKTMFHDTMTETCWHCFDGIDWNVLDAETHCTAPVLAESVEDMLNELEEKKDGSHS